jgi:HEAT repeat protein
MRRAAACVFVCNLFLLAGCDERDEDTPRPEPVTSLSAIANGTARPKNGPDAKGSPEEQLEKQLTKIKETQEKALKAQEEQLKKAKKREKEPGKEKEKEGAPPIGLAIGKNNAKVLELAPPRDKRAKEAVSIRTLNNTGSAAGEVVELKAAGDPKVRSGSSAVRVGDPGASANATVLDEKTVVSLGAKAPEKPGLWQRIFGKGKAPSAPVTAASRGQELKAPAEPPNKKHVVAQMPKRYTPEMRNSLSGVDDLQRRQDAARPGASPDRHDTLSSRIKETMAMKRLDAASAASDKETDPATRPAEVVRLGDNAEEAQATAVDTREPGAPKRAATDDAGNGDESVPLTAEEQKAFSDEEYRTGLASRDVVAREAAFRRAGLERRADGIPYLLEELKQNNLLAAFAVQCLGAIGRLTPEVEAALAQGLASREPAVRSSCAEALGRLRAARAVPAIIQAMQTEKNYQVRCSYLDALGLIGDPAAVPALKAKLAQKEEIEFAKGRAALALARLGDRSGRAHLVRNMDGRMPALQIIGMTGLVQMGDVSAAGCLSAGLESGFEEVWTMAVRLFPQVGSTAALPVLRTRLDSPAEVLRRRAALAMGYLGSDEALPYIDRAARVGSLHERIMACELLGNLGCTDRIPLLIEKLQDPHTAVRQTAAASLAKLNATQAIPALIEAARGRQQTGDLPPALRGGSTDPMERVVILSCLRMLRGEKEDWVIESLPSSRDGTWPEVETRAAEQQMELAKQFQFVDVIGDGQRALGAVLKSPDGREGLYRVGEHVAGGFKVKDIGLPMVGKDKAKIPPYVILMRGNERVILGPGRPAETDTRGQQAAR